MIKRTNYGENKKQYGSLKECQERFGLGKGLMINFAKSINAVAKVGSRTLYNMEKIEDELEKRSIEGE